MPLRDRPRPQKCDADHLGLRDGGHTESRASRQRPSERSEFLSLPTYVADQRHSAPRVPPIPWLSYKSLWVVPPVLNKLTESTETASSKTLDAFAQVIRALAPEVCSVSFHDGVAETLLLSEDFLLPEDHQLVEDCLSVDSTGMHSIQYGTREGSCYSIAIPVRDARNEVNGAVRLSIDSDVDDPRTAESLEQRLAPVMVCLAAEFARRAAVPNLPQADAAQLAQIESALNAERFELFLQPIRSLRANPTMAHYEVLLRLRTLDGILLEPGSFLDAAAHRNLMPSIDRWVVRSLLVWLDEQPQGLDEAAVGLLHQSGIAVDDRCQLHQLPRIVRREERGTAASAVLRDHGTLRLIGQHQRRGIHAAARGAGVRGGAG